MKLSARLLCFPLLLFILCGVLRAEVPNRITYQGRLSKSGVGVADKHIFVVRIKERQKEIEALKARLDARGLVKYQFIKTGGYEGDKHVVIFTTHVVINTITIGKHPCISLKAQNYGSDC